MNSIFVNRFEQKGDKAGNIVLWSVNTLYVLNALQYSIQLDNKRVLSFSHSALGSVCRELMSRSRLPDARARLSLAARRPPLLTSYAPLIIVNILLHSRKLKYPL
ncbi:unnamed protein product [Colias eurytheme]|nr:unnamed protein product [Colias eurytheme]